TRGKKVPHSPSALQRQPRSSACRGLYILHKTAACPGISGTPYYKQSDGTAEVFSEGSSVTKCSGKSFYPLPGTFYSAAEQAACPKLSVQCPRHHRRRLNDTVRIRYIADLECASVLQRPAQRRAFFFYYLINHLIRILCPEFAVHFSIRKILLSPSENKLQNLS